MAINLQKGQKIDLSKSNPGAAKTSATVVPSSSTKSVKPILIAIGAIILFALAFLLITRLSSGNKPQTKSEAAQAAVSQPVSARPEAEPASASQPVSARPEVAQAPASQPVPSRPEAAQTPALQSAFVEIDKVIFSPNTSNFLPNTGVWFDEAANSIKHELEKNPEKMFLITGYSAVAPGPPEPVALSLERARKARDELIKRNIPAGKLETKGAGETSLFGNSREENRRVKITIINSEGTR